MEKKVIDLEIIENIENSGVYAISLVDVPAIEKTWMAFKKEVFVDPKSGERQDDYIPRCIAKLVGDEGYETDQAAAICYSTWRQTHKAEEFAETYTDYPEAAVENAKRALAWAEKNGWGDCGMGAGKARANQLANREPLSRETIARMSAFQRHRQNSDTPYGEGCGKLMWDAWGGDEGIAWAERKLDQIDREEMSIDTSGLPPYVDELPKKKKEEMESTELDIYGYRTSDFHMCPGAVATFTHLMEMNPDEETIGMIRAAAVIADRIFDLEEDVIDDEYASFNDVKEALVLTEDFIDIMGEIDKILGMEHDVSYMIGHVEKIKEYYTENFKFAAPASGKPGDRPLARIPKEERGRTGSAKNKPGDTKNTRGGIEVSQEVEKTLRDKIEEHNKKNPQETQKATMGMLKAVWRRGAGAYSVGTPGKRGMTRAQWAMARVNSFLNILAGNRSGYDKDYNQDNDLLPKGHPKHSEEKMSFSAEDVNYAAILELAKTSGFTAEQFSLNGLSFAKADDDRIEDLKNMNFAKGYSVYKYEGDIGGDSRAFCEEMTAISRFYTYEEVAAMGSAAVNPGFGLGGASTYSIWKYKGGPNCKHRWQKYYVNEAGNFENKGPAPGIAGQRPYDMPNRGYAMSKHVFASEDQRIVIGPAMIPDIVIPRIDKETKERYEVRFSKETIAKIAEKFMRELRNNQTNVQHDETNGAGSYVKESWIVETEDDKANTKYGLDVPVGTWMVAMRVEDPAVWKMVKEGQLNGFSIEGDFMSKEDYEQYQKDKEIYNKVMKILKSI